MYEPYIKRDNVIYVQDDYPHALELLLIDFAQDNTDACEIEDTSNCYVSNAELENIPLYSNGLLRNFNHTFQLNSVNVCNSPRFLSTGSHNVVIAFTLDGENFVLSVQEGEDELCSHVEDVFLISAETTVGQAILDQEMSSDSAREFIFLALAGAVYTTTGLYFSQQGIYRTETSSSTDAIPVHQDFITFEPSDFTVRVVDTNDLMTCQLDEVSNNCFLNDINVGESIVTSLFYFITNPIPFPFRGLF